jgi:hypothetical protein
MAVSSCNDPRQPAAVSIRCYSAARVLLADSCAMARAPAAIAFTMLW